MTREEAIKVAYGIPVTKAQHEALQFLIPELAESEDERIAEELIKTLRGISTGLQYAIFLTEEKKQRWIAWLEKQKEMPTNEEMLRTLRAEYEKGVADTIAKYEQKEQKPVEDKAFAKWVEDFWSHNKVNNMDDAIQFDHKGFVSFCEAYCYPQNMVLHDAFGYEEGRQTGQNEGVNLVLNSPEKYGLQKEQKPAEWSEEDEKRIKQLIYDTEFIKAHYEKKKEQLGERFNDALIKDCDEQIAWLNSLKNMGNFPKSNTNSPCWKPSDIQITELHYAIVPGYAYNCDVLKGLYADLKKLMEE